jgi:hypothetical protein
MLHKKTHFKAAMEYSLNDQYTNRSLRDENRDIERMLLEVNSKMQREREAKKQMAESNQF